MPSGFAVSPRYNPPEDLSPTSGLPLAIPVGSSNQEDLRMNTVERWKQNKHPLDVVEDVKEYANEELSFE